MYLVLTMSLYTVRLDEAEFALTSTSTQKSLKNVKEFTDEYGDTASFAISLLADIYRFVDPRVGR